MGLSCQVNGYPSLSNLCRKVATTSSSKCTAANTFIAAARLRAPFEADLCDVDIVFGPEYQGTSTTYWLAVRKENDRCLGLYGRLEKRFPPQEQKEGKKREQNCLHLNGCGNSSFLFGTAFTRVESHYGECCLARQY
mmetsp:Transcript_82548/g.120959  ORF Transcript_82548/g.120959 Transcript_82548/m.120959 type:complete len:137 (+) Transcript_82548:431-841(+)|eukprot:CAMPEP_0179420164 /NCGR_PEP_ID=MMETSP0799-20121207/9014_1 /TAXON_ID=46947 /ORGANISM="Geminigera cryophila, Strain CCMP2564" /LENGTH=136 /DNA_ID=CAMNT_0021193741 /DNA_START=407 /DNA_END=817 /DNA_ORIENTATION=-